MYRLLTFAAAIGVMTPTTLAAQAPVDLADRPGAIASFLAKEPLAEAPVETPTAAPFQPSGARRRRPSMVGYVEEASLRSQIRIRFDAGRGNDRPDRAEFFYGKCGCYILDPVPFGDVDAPGPGPGVPTELSYGQFYVFGEYAVGQRWSFFAEVPFRTIEPEGFLDFGPPYDPFKGQSGLADVRAGAKVSLMSRDRQALTLQVRTGLPTGDASKGLGSDLVSLEPALLYSHQVGDRLGIEAQLGTWLPFGGSAGVDSPDKFSGRILYYGIGPSFDLIATDRTRFSPVLELVGWRVIGGFQTGCLEDLSCSYDADNNIVSLKMGARTTVNARHSLYVGYGVPLTSAQWYSKILRFEYRLGF